MKTVFVSGIDAEIVRQLDLRVRGVRIVVLPNDVEWPRESPRETALAFLGATPHSAKIESLAKAGFHSLITPDVALSRPQFLALAKEEKVVFANPERWIPSRRLVREQLDAGKLGQPGLARLHQWKSAQEGPWIDGPALLRNLDFVLSLFGSSPIHVFATGTTNLQVHLGFAEGGMATLDHARQLPAGNKYYAFHLVGSTGAVYIDEAANAQIHFRQSHPTACVADEGVVGLAGLVQAFADRFLNRGKLASENWGPTFAVLDAVDTSLKCRQAVSLAEAR